MKSNLYQTISSKENPKFKNISEMKNNKNIYFAEGIRIINEILRENIRIDYLLFTEDSIKTTEINKIINSLKKSNSRLLCLKRSLFNKLADTEEPQGIIAVAERKSLNIEDLFKNIKQKSIFVVLDRIADPGNLGSIIRTCKAAGVAGLIISKGSASIYNPKVIRSTMGAIYGINFCDEVEIIACIKRLKENNVTIITTDLNSSKNIYETKYNLPVCFVFGNEANGISINVLKLGDLSVKLPILGNIESLNVAVSTGIVLYDAINRFRLF